MLQLYSLMRKPAQQLFFTTFICISVSEAESLPFTYNTIFITHRLSLRYAQTVFPHTILKCSLHLGKKLSTSLTHLIKNPLLLSNLTQRLLHKPGVTKLVTWGRFSFNVNVTLQWKPFGFYDTTSFYINFMWRGRGQGGEGPTLHHIFSYRYPSATAGPLW